MTKSDAQWLVDIFNPKRHLRIDSVTIGIFVKAINIIMNSNRVIPGCSCEWKVTATIANSAYEQHEAQILELYNSKPRNKKKK